MNRDIRAVGLRVRIVGEGPPLLLLHGAMVDGRLWDGVVSALAGRFTCVIPDLPLGSHRLPLPADADRSPAGLAARVAALIDALELGPVTLVGNDSGGAVAQLVAADHPDRVDRLILTNCDALEVLPPPAYAWLGWVGHSPLAMWLLGTTLAVAPALARLPTAFGWLADRFDGALLRAWFAPLRDPAIRADLGGFLRGVRPSVTLEAAERLAARGHPVLLAWGERDPFFRVALAERLAAKLPGARLVRLDARCFVPLDAPGPLAERIAAFVDEAAAARRIA